MDLVYIAILTILLFVLPLVTILLLFLYKTLSEIYDTRFKTTLYANEKEYYYAQCRLMQESVDKAKSIRHDMKNHLATLKDISKTGGHDVIEKYIDSLIDEIGINEIYCNTGNIALDSIINFKLSNAQSNNIKYDLRASIPSNLNIDTVDIVTIFGNLLDNALEAVDKVNEKFIIIDIMYDKSSLYIKIENSYNGETKYSSNKNEEDAQLLSLKSGNNHGYGLKNVKHSVEKYNGYMKIAHSNSIFTVGLFLYVEEE